jgi:xylulokinase
VDSSAIDESRDGDADTGELVGSGRAAHPATFPPRSEQDPESWREALVEARRRAGTPAVVAMAIAAQQHGLVALDDRAEVIRPAKLWNDTESADDAQWLVEQLGGPEPWVEACGSVPVASFTISKLSWLHRCEPENFDRLARVLLPHDWLTSRMSGRFTTDRGDASGTGYWSPAQERWRTDLLEVIDDTKDWGACLPRCSARPGWFVKRGRGDRARHGDNTAALGVALEPGRVAIDRHLGNRVHGQRPTDPKGCRRLRRDQAVLPSPA